MIYYYLCKCSMPPLLDHQVFVKYYNIGWTQKLIYFKKYHFLFRVLSTSSMQNQNGVQQKLSRWKEEMVDMASVLLALLL